MDDLQELVFTAIGMASMCWEPRPSGVFDSTTAKNIGDDLVAALQKKLSPALPASNSTKVETVTPAQCHAYADQVCNHNCVKCKHWF